MPEATVEIPEVAPILPESILPEKIIHTLDLDEIETSQQKAFTKAVLKETQEEINKQLETKLPEISIEDHTDINTTNTVVTPTPEKLSIDITPTTEVLKDINVVYNEVLVQPDADFEIIDTTVRSIPQENQPEKAPVNNGMLLFDMPLQPENPVNEKQEVSQPVSENEIVSYNLEEDITINKVNETPEKEFSFDQTQKVSKETTYNLEDYMELEETLEAASPSKENIEDNEIDETVVFETKTREVHSEEIIPEEEVDPMNSPISKLLVDRAEERKRKMKEFNYKFKHNQSRIDDIEKQPAYKRMGIDLEDAPSKENGLSRTSLSTDDNDEIQLRRNNSFLHDNVD